MSTRPTIRLNTNNFRTFKQRPPSEYKTIRFDSNNDCNIHCVYCHIPRSNDQINLDEFTEFVEQKVVCVEQFQIGCIMEPTLDRRLCDFMDAIAASPAAPSKLFRLQTNGILLHRHEATRMQAAGLTRLTVSVDSVTGDTHKSLRGGTSLSKVQRNIVAFRRGCPDVTIVLLTTVMADNIDEVDDLLAWGLDEGVDGFELRQMFYHPDNPIVDHDRMPHLLVTAEQFAAMRDRIELRFKARTRLHFQTNDELIRRDRDIKEQSF